MNNSKQILDESRISIVDGVVKVKHVINESANIDLTPHPTETRVLIENGKVKIIYSKEIEINDSMTIEESKAIVEESIRKEYLLP